jgi:hypothetical protein
MSTLIKPYVYLIGPADHGPVPEKTKRPLQEANPAAANSIPGETCGPSSMTARAVLIADRAI